MASAHELVQSCSNLFTLPEIYLRVRDVVDNPESTMDDLANALKFDPAISARLLKIVNSPLYGFPKQIDNIARAVTLLGMQPVSDLVASTTIGQTFTGMTADLMDLPAFWRKSVRCALLARKIAQNNRHRRKRTVLYRGPAAGHRPLGALSNHSATGTVRSGRSRISRVTARRSGTIEHRIRLHRGRRGADSCLGHAKPDRAGHSPSTEPEPSRRIRSPCIDCSPRWSSCRLCRIRTGPGWSASCL